MPGFVPVFAPAALTPPEGTPLAAVAILGLVLAACTVAGRLISTHAAAPSSFRADLRTPLSALMSGTGLLTLWWLVLMPTLGAGNLVTAGLFGLSVVAMAGAMFRVWRRHPEESHNNALFLLLLLISAPLFLPLLAIGWQTAPELQTAQLIHQLSRFPGWPDAVQYATYALPPLTGNPPAWLAFWLPVQGATALALAPAGPWPGLMGALNGLLVLGMAGHVLAVLHVPVRWSNLLLCTAGGLAVMACLMPLGLSDILIHPGPQVMALAAALVLYTPLAAPLPLPMGMAALVPALAGAALTGLHPLGLPLALLAAVLWALRGLLTGAVNHALGFGRYVFAVSAMACLPLLVFLLWQNAQTNLGQSLLPLLLHALTHPSGLPPLVAGLLPQVNPSLCLLPAAVLVFVPVILLRCMPMALLTPRALLVTHAPFTLPALLALVVVLLACWPAFQPLAAAASQVLLPVWMIPPAAAYHHIYRRSPLKRAAFAHPWWVGLMLAALLVALGLAWQPRLATAPDADGIALATMGEELRTRPLIPFGQPLATLGYAAPATGLLSFALAHYAPVTSLPENLKTRTQLHTWMRRNGITWLLANGRNSATARLLGVPQALPTAMLFRADPAALTLTAAWGAEAMDHPKPH